MNIVPDRTNTVHTHADEWAAWTDDHVWMTGPEHDDDDERWASEHLNEDWHDLDGHPVIDDDEREAEAEYWREQERRNAADPTDDDIAETWTDGDEWEADGRFDDRAAESAWLDAHEQGLKTF
jgi:hypothetical protein